MTVRPDTDEWLRQIDHLQTQLITAIRSKPAAGSEMCIARLRVALIEHTDGVIDAETARLLFHRASPARSLPGIIGAGAMEGKSC